jgi:mannose-6-phosphate isomerase-like protein (cupin superfamily)
MSSHDTSYRRSFEEPDDRKTKGGVQIDVAKLGELTVKRATYPPGWRFSKDMGAERCLDTHVGYMASGTIHVILSDATELDIKAGDAVMIPAGHDAWVVGEEPATLVQFDEGESAAKRFAVKAPLPKAKVA